MGSYESRGDVLYSAADAGDPATLFHGLASERVRYRHDDSTRRGSGGTELTDTGAFTSADQETASHTVDEAPVPPSKSADRNTIASSQSSESPKSSGETSARLPEPPAMKKRKLNWEPREKTKRLVVPKIVSKKIISDNREKLKELERQSGCSIQFVDKGKDTMVEINGPAGEVDRVSESIENLFVESTQPNEQARLLFMFLRLNLVPRDSRVAGRAVRQRSPVDLKTMKWMAVMEFPRDDSHSSNYLGKFLGVGFHHIKNISVRKNCRVEVNQGRGAKPHLFIEGDDSNDVNNCLKMLQDRFDHVRNTYWSEHERCPP